MFTELKRLAGNAQGQGCPLPAAPGGTGLRGSRVHRPTTIVGDPETVREDAGTGARYFPRYS